jgi:hypothetical protein
MKRTQNRFIADRAIDKLSVVRGPLSVASEPRIRKPETTDNGLRTAVKWPDDPMNRWPDLPNLTFVAGSFSIEMN